MGINYRRANPQFGYISSARYLTIATSPVTLLRLGSGNSAFSIFNNGSASLIWGDSSITVNSGNTLFPYSRIQWDNLIDNWGVFVIAESVQTLITVTEDKG